MNSEPTCRSSPTVAGAAGRYPDFLVIGAQKAGTSWLFEHLRHHPQIWLPPTKEIHYFDDLWPNSFLLDLLARVYRANTNNPNIDFDQMRWFAHFALTRPRTDAWYASLFAPAGQRRAGDITPAYSMLDEQKVAHVHSLMPEAAIIFVMRDPIDRIWSHFCFSESWKTKGIPASELSDDVIIAEMDTEPYDLRTRYCRTIAIWSKFFREDQFLILFYEDIENDPEKLFHRITSKLGIGPLPTCKTSDIREKKKGSIPLTYGSRLPISMVRRTGPWQSRLQFVNSSSSSPTMMRA